MEALAIRQLDSNWVQLGPSQPPPTAGAFRDRLHGPSAPSPPLAPSTLTAGIEAACFTSPAVRWPVNEDGRVPNSELLARRGDRVAEALYRTTQEIAWQGRVDPPDGDARQLSFARSGRGTGRGLLATG